MNINMVYIIKTALDNVGQGYYRVIASYSNSGIVRERVFCYEFYHQLRNFMGENALLSLCAEIDKRGHKQFRIEDRKNPDFILHNAGEFQNNELVIEVKGKMNKRQIQKDFETLQIFVERYGYRLGVFILYNYCLAEFVKKFHKWYEGHLDEKFANVCNRIVIICKKDAFSQSEVIKLEDLTTSI